MNNDKAKRYAPFRWSRVDLTSHADDSPRLSELYRRWCEYRGASPMPRWDISVLESLPDETIPFVNVIDVNGAGPPFCYRFFGTGLANMHLFELTNTTTDAIEPKGFRNLCVDQHVMTIERREPMMFANEIPTKNKWLYMNHVMLRLPFSGDGETVSQILTVEDSIGSPEKVWARFRDKHA